MNLIVNIIFLVTCYPIMFLMYFLMRNAKDKNAWCFGATLSRELKNDPAVEAIDTEYRRNLKNSMIVLGILPFCTFFIPWFSISFSIWMMWILVICFLPMYWYAKANKQVQELKRERGWNQTNEVSYADLKMANVPRKVKFITFLPMLFLSTIPIIVAFVLFRGDGYDILGWLVALFGLCTYLFYGCAVWTDRQKVSAISEDSDINMNYARAKKQAWKQFWVICGWVNTVFTWCVLAFIYFRNVMMSGILIGTVVYGIGIVLVTLWLLKKLNAINEKYDAQRTIVDASDDDKNWIYGLMYYNKKDSHLMVENRMGTGAAMNMASGITKGSYIFSALCILALPITCIWIIMLEFTPIQTTIVDNVIVCQHLSVDYEIPLEDIEAYEIVTDRPQMTKVMGTNTETLLSGTYEIYREGMFETFLNPQNELFIKIKTEEETYYISGVDDAQTQVLIETVQAVVDE